MRLLFTALAFCFLFSSCDPNNPDGDGNLLTQQVYSTLEVSNSPIVSYNTVFGFDQTYIQITDGQIFHTSDITEYNVIEGGTFYYSISMLFAGGLFDIGECSDVTIKTYQNNNLVDEQTFQMGISSMVDESTFIYCDPLAASGMFTDNLSLTAE